MKVLFIGYFRANDFYLSYNISLVKLNKRIIKSSISHKTGWKPIISKENWAN